MWGFWSGTHWRGANAAIVDGSGSGTRTLNAAGIRYEALMDEWTTNDSSITDSNRNADFRGFYGKYRVTLTPPGAEPTVVDVNILPGEPNDFTIELTDYTCQQIQDAGLALASDLTGDCYADFNDLQIVAQYWLRTDCATHDDCEGADFEPTDGTVDFFDFSDFTMQWMQCNNPEDPNCTPNWP